MFTFGTDIYGRLGYETPASEKIIINCSFALTFHDVYKFFQSLFAAMNKREKKMRERCREKN